MLSKPLHIYRASAGSGKTFLLASQYLSLLFEHPFKYREILAVTFTNKATDEMKSRILGELKKLAMGIESPYATIIREKHPDLIGTALQQKADLTYRRILHDYANFSVGTIDSFVQQVIRAFAFEIGLDAGYQLELNSKLVKEALADKLFTLLDTNAPLREWITELAQERIAAGKHWDFRNAMLELADEIFKERFYLFEENMRRLEEPEKSFRTLRKELQEQLSVFEKKMAALGLQALDLISSVGLQPTDFKYGKAGFANYFQKTQTNTDYQPGQRVLDALDNADGWLAKDAGLDIKEKVNAIFPRLNQVLSELLSFYQQHAIEYHSAVAVYQNLYNLNLLRVLADQLGDYRRQNNTLLISDTHNLLRELVRDNEAPFLFEKTGNRYQHFLLDEFQDTSSFQWQNFRPLLEQSIATGSYNLLVGDVKQAIYRWRNGDWRLLLTEVRNAIGANRVHESSLQENYRSTREIIAFNNHVFTAAPLLLQEQFNADMAAITASSIREELQAQGYFSMITLAYQETIQAFPSGVAEGGGISVRLFDQPDSRTKRWREEANTRLPGDIERMILEEGIAAAGIAILTRNNHEARTIIDLLLQYQQSPEARCHYPILSAEALLINNSPAIQLLIAATQLLHDPANQLARANLVQANAIRLENGLSDPRLYKLTKDTAAAQLPAAFTEQFFSLQWQSLFDAVEALISIFSLDEWVSEQAYLLHFRDLVNSFSKKGQSTLRDFLQWWADDGIEKALPAAAGEPALQVMTIHKAKGLAFDAVCLPYADWEFSNDKGNIWCRFGSKSGIDYVPVKLGRQLRETSFAFDYYEEQLLSIMDGLNLLYVAFTRPRKKLLVYGPATTKAKSGSAIKTVADLIITVLGHPNAGAQFPDQSARWAEDIWEVSTVPPTNVPELDAEKNIIQLKPRITTALPSRLHASAPERWLLESAGSPQQVMGKLLHLALSRINNRTEVDQQLQQLLSEGTITTGMLPELEDKIDAVLREPQMAGWYDGSYTVISERAILLQGGSIRRPDKVFYKDGETILIDFKFTQSASPAHTVQLEEYKSLLEGMGYQQVQAYLYYGYQQTLVPLAQLPRTQGNLFK